MRIAFVLAAALWALSARAADASPMKFRVLNIGGTRVLLGEGEIARSSDRAFKAALRKAGNVPVLLHSPGGDLAGGLLLGFAFRETGSRVGVAPGGGCFSACAYAMLGGVNRKVYAGGQFGVHEFSERDRKADYVPNAREKAEDKQIQALLRAYAKDMGVSPDLIGLATKTRNDSIRVLSSKELNRMRVVTGR